jgi:NADH-quinone oxidoreductase subunit J
MELVLFLITALVTIVAAVGMVLSKNAVHSALWLVLNLLGVAVFYLLLHAPFLAMIQITIYAGAIMVLFLFVIMLLGAEKGQEERNRLPGLTPVALVLGLLLIGMSGYALFGVDTPLLEPPPPANAELAAPTTLARELFSTYLLPFEITGVLLLVALIGAIVLTIKSRRGERS